MLSPENFTSEHIASLRKETGSDPSLLERTVYAFGLLEAIANTGMKFAFKGGTSLLLSLRKPRRLSTDIDIVVEPGTDLDAFIEKAGGTFPFLSAKEEIRKRRGNIEKRHFKFRFPSPLSQKEIGVLLDVVFETNPYERLVERPIRNGLLLSEGEDLMVAIPDKNTILGDKLTAFAPHTSGIPFDAGKELEIIKQLFDCWTILQEADDYRSIAKAYRRIAPLEIAYRGLPLTEEDCLKDTIESCICLMGRGSIRKDDYRRFSSGVEAIQGHLFKGKLSGESIVSCASEVMYLATCILTKQESMTPINDFTSLVSINLNLEGIKKISGFRNTRPHAYAYMVRSFQLLNEQGLYAKSVLEA